MTPLARPTITLLLSITVTSAFAEEPADEQPALDPSVVVEPANDPSLIQQTSSAVVSGAQKVRDTTLEVSRGVVERSGEWADQGRQGAGKAWSVTRDTTTELVDKTVQGVGSGFEYVRDGSARLVDKSADAGGAAWDKTRRVSSAAVEKGQAVVESIKTEIVGTSEPPADVIDKSVPATP